MKCERETKFCLGTFFKNLTYENIPTYEHGRLHTWISNGSHRCDGKKFICTDEKFIDENSPVRKLNIIIWNGLRNPYRSRRICLPLEWVTVLLCFTAVAQTELQQLCDKWISLFSNIFFATMSLTKHDLLKRKVSTDFCDWFSNTNQIILHNCSNSSEKMFIMSKIHWISHTPIHCW